MLQIFGRHSIPSAVFLASTFIYVMSPDLGGSEVERRGKRRKTVLQAASPSAHAVTIQRMSRKPTCCTDPNAASKFTNARVCTHTHSTQRTAEKGSALGKKKAYN